jgi:di/tricarboxylate transporter
MHLSTYPIDLHGQYDQRGQCDARKWFAVPGRQSVDSLLQTLPPWLMIFFILLLTTLISNILNNAVAAVLMSPTAIILAQSGLLNISVDALLMAVAAGASLGIILPTNQSTLIVMSSTSFSRKSFIKIGAVLFLVSGIIASLVIYMIWL